MKIVLILLISTFVFSQHHEYQKLKQNHLMISASKTIKVPCDLLEFSFTVTEKGSSLEEAVNKAKHRMNKISSRLMKLGLAEKNLSTSNFFSGENIGDKAFLSSKRDYKASVTTQVSMTDLNLAEKVLILISQENPDNISELNYKLENKDDHEIKVIELATIKARKKAERMAKSLNTQIKGVLFVEDQNVHFSRPMLTRSSRAKKMEMAVSSYDAPSMPLFTQDRQITGNVRIIFLLK